MPFHFDKEKDVQKGDIVFVETSRWCPSCHRQMEVRRTETIDSERAPGTTETLIWWHCSSCAKESDYVSNPDYDTDYYGSGFYSRRYSRPRSFPARPGTVQRVTPNHNTGVTEHRDWKPDPIDWAFVNGDGEDETAESAEAEVQSAQEEQQAPRS